MAEEKTGKLNINTVVKTSEDVYFVEAKEHGESFGDEESFSSGSYDESLDWTEEEETVVRNKLDIKLMTFMLLMTFVLNMDRTNIGKVYIAAPIFKYKCHANSISYGNSKRNFRQFGC